MHQNASASASVSEPGGYARVRLDNDHYTLVTNMLGYTTEASRADFSGVHYTTLRDYRTGSDVGEKFIANTLARLNRHRDWFAEKNTPITFESLFPIVPSPEGQPSTDEVVAA